MLKPDLGQIFDKCRELGALEIEKTNLFCIKLEIESLVTENYHSSLRQEHVLSVSASSTKQAQLHRFYTQFTYHEQSQAVKYCSFLNNPYDNIGFYCTTVSEH